MEKIINIDGKDVKFKSTGATTLRYKAQFGEDYFEEIVKMSKTLQEGKATMSNFNLDVFYKIVWILAKTANKDIPTYLEWYDEFDNFPIIEVATELQDLIQSTMVSKKK